MRQPLVATCLFLCAVSNNSESSRNSREKRDERMQKGKQCVVSSIILYTAPGRRKALSRGENDVGRSFLVASLVATRRRPPGQQHETER